MTDNNDDLNKRIDELLKKADLFFTEINEIRTLINTVKTQKQEEPQERYAEPLPLQPNTVVENKPYIPVEPIKIEPQIIQPPVAPVINVSPVNITPQNYQQNYQKRNNNIEKFIGENLINKIGIVILVIGIGFFVKYAIDKNWINEFARTAIGVVSGFLLIGFGYILKKKYRAFSSVLCGGGISVLYFSIYIAFRQYELFSQTAAFGIFIAITALAIVLSLWFDRMELAIIAIAGGFCSPLMASTGNGNYIVLFSYLIILNSGILFLAYRKKWSVLNIISFGFTILFFGTWFMSNLVIRKIDPPEGAFIFATAFFLLFFAMNIINTIREKRNFGVFEIVMLSLNNFFYILVGITVVRWISSYDLRGVFAASLGVFNLIFWFTLSKNQNIDKVFKYLLLGFGISFISIAGPLELHDNFVTLFFATEFVLLFWIAIKSNLKMLFTFSTAVLFIVLVSLAIDWMVIYSFTSADELPVVFNKVFLTGLFVVAAVLLNAFINNRYNNSDSFGFFYKKTYNAILTGTLIYLFFFVIQTELSFQMTRYIYAITIRSIITYSYISAYFLLLLVYFRNNRKNYIPVILAVVAVFISLLYPFTSHSSTVIIRNYSLYVDAGSIWAFYFHYLNLALMALSMYFVYFIIKSRASQNSLLLVFFQWYVCILAVFAVSTETHHISVLINYTSLESIPVILKMTNKMSFSVIWGLTSFVFMIFGLKQNIRNLRIISLSLFTLTLIKLFTFDIIDMSAGAKTIAFICLGIILLTVSFLYQKLKKLIFEDEQENAD